MNSLTQPPPTQGQQSVTEKLIEYLREREAKGIATYGTSLQTFNGRKPLCDALEEVLDLAQYIMQEIVEREKFEKIVDATIAYREQRCSWIHVAAAIKEYEGGVK